MNNIQLDMDNKCIRIDGVFYLLSEMKDGLCLEPDSPDNYNVVKYDGKTWYIRKSDLNLPPMQPTKESIDVPMQEEKITKEDLLKMFKPAFDFFGINPDKL
jgi:hypothetical protein